MRVGDLVSISPAAAVVSLSDLEGVREKLHAGKDAHDDLTALLTHYFLGEPETRSAFESIIRSLGRAEQRGDAFLVQGVYGSGKSHLLAALALLCGSPKQAWPAFLSSHLEYERAAVGFENPRLVVAIPLDEYPTQTHTLEHVVLSSIERELARRHGLRVALTQHSHLLDLVDRYAVPQIGVHLDEASQQAAGADWRELRTSAPDRAAEIALETIEQTRFPLDWRRSRAEAWGALHAALEQRQIDGPVLLLDELGISLAGKDRTGLNADASFLQYIAQRTAAERCWLVCVTQRGLEEVGDIDRRTLRQMRDRFRAAFTLDLSELGWLVEHRLVLKRERAAFRRELARLFAQYRNAAPDVGFSEQDLAISYPLNPLCLRAVQRAGETCLSRTRSVLRLLQRAAADREWLDQPAHRLITPDVAFDLFREEMDLSAAGRQHLHAYEVVTANGARIAPGREPQLQTVMKTLCLLGLGGLRWSVAQVRDSLVGCEQTDLWQDPRALHDLLLALYRRGAYVERLRVEGELEDEFFVDVASDVSERIRQRLNELTADLAPADSRVAAAALQACREAAFPLAGLAESRSLPVEWQRARRYVNVVCRDFADIGPGELPNLVGVLESPASKEDASLFLALPTRDPQEQSDAWLAAVQGARGRFAHGLLAWLPRRLTDNELDHLVEHAALASMVADPTAGGRRDREMRERLREQWADSEAEVGRMLQGAFYQGRIIGEDADDAIEPERLSALLGQWDETLAAAFAPRFARIFPRFSTIAPARRLAGRAQTNQIIDQFIRPAHVALPPASTLEAHLLAYAAPLGLLGGEDRHYRLALTNRDLLATALAAAPERSARDTLDPGETIAFAELAGGLAKSDWGMIREQAELLLAAMIRTGHLVALDAFLEPVRLEAVAAPLGDHLPYVMRGAALAGAAAKAAAALWAAATGRAAGVWDLPTQERAWGDLIAWSARVLDAADGSRASLAGAAEALGNTAEEWNWALESLARAEAVARSVSPSLTSAEGLRRLVEAASRLPGAAEETARALESWRGCERFLQGQLDALAALYRLLTHEKLRLPEESLLARDHQELRSHFASPRRLVSGAEQVKSAAARWLEAYRRHYLGWHGRVHAASRFEALLKARQSAALEAARRLARVGLCSEEVGALEAELIRALGRRCLVADPLPMGSAVCPSCGIALGEETQLPSAAESAKRLERELAGQLEELRRHADLLRRRSTGCRDRQVKECVERLVIRSGETTPEDVNTLLCEEAIVWLRRQLGQPRARRRELSKLEGRLRGKEVAAGEALRMVEEWLDAGEDDVVEIV